MRLSAKNHQIIFLRWLHRLCSLILRNENASFPPLATTMDDWWQWRQFFFLLYSIWFSFWDNNILVQVMQLSAIVNRNVLWEIEKKREEKKYEMKMKCAAWLNNCFSFEFGDFVWHENFVGGNSSFLSRDISSCLVMAPPWNKEKKNTGKNFEITTGLLLAAINNNVRLQMSQKHNHSFYFASPRVCTLVFISFFATRLPKTWSNYRTCNECSCRVYFYIINIPKYFLCIARFYVNSFSTHSQIRIFMDLTYRIITHVSETIDLCAFV